MLWREAHRDDAIGSCLDECDGTATVFACENGHVCHACPFLGCTQRPYSVLQLYGNKYRWNPRRLREHVQAHATDSARRMVATTNEEMAHNFDTSVARALELFQQVPQEVRDALLLRGADVEGVLNDVRSLVGECAYRPSRETNGALCRSFALREAVRAGVAAEAACEGLDRAWAVAQIPGLLTVLSTGGCLSMAGLDARQWLHLAKSGRPPAEQRAAFELARAAAWQEDMSSMRLFNLAQLNMVRPLLPSEPAPKWMRMQPDRSMGPPPSAVPSLAWQASADRGAPSPLAPPSDKLSHEDRIRWAQGAVAVAEFQEAAARDVVHAQRDGCPRDARQKAVWRREVLRFAQAVAEGLVEQAWARAQGQRGA